MDIPVNILHKKSLGSLLLIWVKIDKEEWHFIQVSQRKKKVSYQGNPEIISRIRAKMCKFSGLNLIKVSTVLLFWRNRRKFISLILIFNSLNKSCVIAFDQQRKNVKEMVLWDHCTV